MACESAMRELESLGLVIPKNITWKQASGNYSDSSEASTLRQSQRWRKLFNFIRYVKVSVRVGGCACAEGKEAVANYEGTLRLRYSEFMRKHGFLVESCLFRGTQICNT